MMAQHHLSQRHASQVMGIARSTVRYQPHPRLDEADLVAAVRDYAHRLPSYGYRHVTAVMRREGYRVNRKRIYRLWRQEGLQLPRRTAHKRRVGERGEVKRRAEYPNHVWSYDFLEDHTERGGKLRFLTILDEFTRECLTIYVARSIPARRVIDLLGWLLVTRGRPHHLRSDNGPEFIAHAVQDWLAQQGSQTLYIQPGHPWENPFIESFNGTFRSECLDRYLFQYDAEAQHIAEAYRVEYNTYRPHSSLGYLTPAEFAQQQVVIPLTHTGT
jgi:transposase InsO family protein